VTRGALADLTACERRVVHYLRRGLQNKEIALILQSSPNTVRNHLAAIFRKLGVSTRSQLAAMAERAGA
jgi:DNA-binding CsgD family transcriptional regulator